MPGGPEGTKGLGLFLVLRERPAGNGAKIRIHRIKDKLGVRPMPTGEVTLGLYKGNVQPLSRKSPYSLYSLDIASFTMGASYDQKDALGFINLIGLPVRIRAAVAQKT